ncbi:MAG TPA: peptide-methionine (S)-S-oxide reductase MsrA [Gammaproteobacteria bacterium]|nr:peptide-methionine (S)-S-oxide reductase MsrA [Gammaproteobacteria bacterium]
MKIVPPRHPVAERHAVLDRTIVPPFPDDARFALFGLGCFWGAERAFWQRGEVLTTAVGYAGGHTEHPTYREVCTGNTGHAEVVLVVYEGDDEVLSALLDVFWEDHDPTQGMRQGNDVGSQYRSAIYLGDDGELELAAASRDRYQKALTAAGFGAITTEIAKDRDFYYAEDYHQQYLAKNPAGYCSLGGTGVKPAAARR